MSFFIVDGIGLDFFEESAAILLTPGFVDKYTTAFAGNFFVTIFLFFAVAFGQRHATANTLAFGEEPGLDWSNYVFKHDLNLFYRICVNFRWEIDM